jgi:hypothetical protein
LKLIEVNKNYYFLHQGTQLCQLPQKFNGQIHSTKITGEGQL